ncbi:hypothetical protein [Salegentibacter mishustinae]|uniref:hypothetical protein n=1 Tax=Salegentibacter mishustinae TaxID=270918 RepID=UPI0024903855|nr:hypothetical protein [Salegentibacter mishustinae]
MMKTKVLLFFLLASLISCSDDDSEECIGYRPENVKEVNAPSTGQVDEPVEIQVKFPVYNGCGKFEKFIESGSEQSKVIEVQAKYEGCICTQDIPIITAVYEFTPSTTGVYELKFKSGETDYITVTITITD